MISGRGETQQLGEMDHRRRAISTISRFASSEREGKRGKVGADRLWRERSCAERTWQIGGFAQVGGCMTRNPGDDGDKEDAHNNGAAEVARHENGHDGEPGEGQPQGGVRHLRPQFWCQQGADSLAQRNPVL